MMDGQAAPFTPEQEASIREIVAAVSRATQVRALPSAAFERSIVGACPSPSAPARLQRTWRACAIVAGCIAQAFRRQHRAHKLLVGSAPPDGTFLRPACRFRKGAAHDPEQ